MADYLVTDTELTSIANAIRTKGGTSASLEFPSEFVSAIANIPSGGSGEWTTDGIARLTEPNGDITITLNNVLIGERAFFKRTGITGVTFTGNPYLGNYCFGSCTGIRTINAPLLTRFYSSNYNVSSYVFEGCTGLTAVAFPSHGNYAVPSYTFQNCSNLQIADFNNFSGLQNAFTGCTALRTLIIRKTNEVPTASGWNANVFGGIYNNPTSSTIYVPSSMISSYESATNWLSAKNAGVTFTAIEGSQYENYYADGTPIE